MPMFDARLRGRRRTTSTWRCRCRGRTRAAVRRARREAGRRAVREGGRSGSGRGGSRWSASAWSRACPTCSPATPPTSCSREIDEIGVRDGANLTVDGYDFAPVVLDLDDDRGVPQPAGGLGGGARLVHHGAVQRARGVRLPRGHRPGRVRERGARGGAARPALGRRRSGSPSSTAWATSSSTVLQGAAQARPRPHPAGAASRAVEVSPRDVVAACLPDPARPGRPDARQDLRRDRG